ncbi:MAG TPA: alcohol dehydrogenase catalytic domain-containing protein [Streptosporangiaceae bacterium]
MRAVVCVPGGTEVASVPDPRPATGQVIVEVDACGLCGSDVHAIAERFTEPGQILGHEFSGLIAATGPGVTGWHTGQAVAVNPLGSCRSCRACASGLPFRCPEFPNLGLSAPGAYAQYVAVQADQLVRLPDGVPAEAGAHAEPLAVAMQAVTQADPQPGGAALVYGVGPIGLNVIMALRLTGVDLIVGAGRSPGRRAAAQAAGADVVLDTREISVAEYAGQSGRRFDSVFECSAARGSADEALAVLQPGGCFVELALTGQSAAVSLERLVQEGLRLAGTCAYSYPTYEAAVDAIVSGRVPAAGLISERVSLDETPAVLARLRQPGNLVRVLSRPWAANGSSDSGRDASGEHSVGIGP